MLEPAVGRLTGADSGAGRLPEPAEIFAAAVRLLAQPARRPGRRTWPAGAWWCRAGGTREPIDPVRFLGNWSSGRQGYALARAAVARGAEVTRGRGERRAARPGRAAVIRVGRRAELRSAVTAAAADADVVVMAAAVADFRPEVRSEDKIKKDAAADPEPLRWSATPTSWPSWPRPRPRRRPARRRIRRRDR